MKYPVEIRIHGYNYRIEYLEYQREVDRDFESEDYLGTCDSSVIRVLATKSRLSLLETLVHEVLHAIFTRNKMLKSAIKHNLGEEFVTTLAAEIALLLLDNELVKFPTKGPPITVRIVPEARPFTEKDN